MTQQSIMAQVVAEGRARRAKAKVIRLSRLHKRIIAEVAAHTAEPDDDWEFDQQYVPYRKLLEHCYSHWDAGTPEVRLLAYRPKIRVAKSAFSRAVHRLIKADILHGLALAWMLVVGEHEEFHGWAGRGSDTPRIRFVTLTERGREIAEQLAASGCSIRQQ
jgi:hypothetical protein